MTTKKHKKHANLKKPSLGKFGRNEWAIIGAPCGDIRNLVEKLATVSSGSILYIDESHDKDAEVASYAVAIKKSDSVDLAEPQEWNKHYNYGVSNDFHYVLVNGNHFKAQKQIVVLDKRKKESLSRKLDRLTDVRLFLTTDEIREPYDFLKDETSDGISSLHINDTQGIYEFMKSDYLEPQLKGLILAGGRSIRMGEDKGEISYHGVSQTEHLHRMMEGLGIEVFISCREEQKRRFKDLTIIEDKFIGLGPFGAIASAFMSDPDSAWLVVPCDLPLLDEANLVTLTSKRNPEKYATAYLNSYTQFPEPLISIWEPRMYQQMMSFLSQGYSCPRKVLINSDVELLEVEDQEFMMNVNTPEDRRRVEILLEERQG